MLDYFELRESQLSNPISFLLPSFYRLLHHRWSSTSRYFPPAITVSTAMRSVFRLKQRWIYWASLAISIARSFKLFGHCEKVALFFGKIFGALIPGTNESSG